MDVTKVADDVKKDLDKYFEEAAEWLLNYESRKRQYYKDQMAIRYETLTPEVFVKTGPGNVVIQEVLRNSDLDYTEKWLIAVEIVVELFDSDKLAFLELRRKAHKQARDKSVKGRPAWRGYVKKNYPGKLSDGAITDWWNGMVNIMRVVALMRECYKK